MRTQFRRVLLTIAFAAVASSCEKGAAPVPAETQISRQLSSIDPSFAPIPPPPPGDPSRIKLGYRLFREKRLSSDNTVACISCHNLGGNGADSKPFSTGVRGAVGEVNTPPVFNASLNFRQFWDGRAKTLEEQVAGPITNSLEMASSWSQVSGKLNADPLYAKQFQQIYGGPADAPNVADALAAFENTLLTPNAPFDRFLQGEESALSRAQKRGYEKFRTYGCVACHQGVNLGGNMFQTFGIMGDYFKDRGGHYASDQGLFRQTHNPADLHVFRVPSLRNVALQAAYFHDGQGKDLNSAVRVMAKYQLGRTLSPAEVDDLTEFLRSLTGERPKLPESE